MRNLHLQQLKKITIKEKGRIRQVELHELTHIVATGHVSTVKTTDHKSYSSYKLLKEYENELNDPFFFRINRNVLVNLKHLTEYKNNGKPTCTLKCNSTLVISRRNLKSFISKIK
jgi:DNA-binding LytR/AlgR family response regulator